MKHLHNRNGIWYVRKHIPAPVRSYFGGRGDVWLSLGTPDRRQAERNSHAVLAKLNQEIDEARRLLALAEGEAARMATPAVDGLLNHLSGVAQQLGLFVPSFATAIGSPEDKQFVELALKLGQVTERPKSAAEAIKLVDQALEQLDWEQEHAVRLHLGVDDGQPHWLVPARYVDGLQRWVEEQFEATRRTLEAIRSELTAIGAGVDYTDQSAQADGAAASECNGATLSVLLEASLPQRAIEPKTVLESKTAIRRFEAVAGPLPYREITIEHVRRYKASLVADTAMKSATKIKQWSMVRSLLNFAKDDGLIANSPFDAVKLGRLPDDAQARDEFNQADLNKLFSRLQGDEWWLARIALYTGARLGEICQLTTADIINEEGVLSFSIHPDDEAGTRVKTRNSIRKVPVHQQLMADGLEDRLGTKGNGRLFPWTSPVASKRLNRRLGEVGLSNGKVVHSFRHTFISSARKVMSEEEREWLVGHKSQRVGRTYGSYPNLKAKLDLVSFSLE